MKFSAAAIVAFLASAASVSANYDHCSAVTVRKEINDMTAADWAIYEKGILAATTTKAPTGGKSLWDTWSNVHNAQNSYIHGNAVFLYWHRKFIRYTEVEIQKLVPGFQWPYWAYERVYKRSDFAQSKIWKIIGSGVKGQPVTDGFLVGKTFDTTTYNGKGLVRGYTYPQFAHDLYSVEVYSQVYTNTLSQGGFSYYASQTELLHGMFHVILGGDDGSGFMNTMNSPTDPAFFLHHANIDKMFADSQAGWTAAGYTNNSFKVGGNYYDGKPLSLSSKLPGYTETVADVVDTADLCVKYARVGEVGTTTTSATATATAPAVRTTTAPKTLTLTGTSGVVFTTVTQAPATIAILTTTTAKAATAKHTGTAAAASHAAGDVPSATDSADDALITEAVTFTDSTEDTTVQTLADAPCSYYPDSYQPISVIPAALPTSWLNANLGPESSWGPKVQSLQNMLTTVVSAVRAGATFAPLPQPVYDDTKPYGGVIHATPTPAAAATTCTEEAAASSSAAAAIASSLAALAPTPAVAGYVQAESLDTQAAATDLTYADSTALVSGADQTFTVSIAALVAVAMAALAL